MRLLVLHVAGLTNGAAKRPDLARGLSGIMETGAYLPVFPEFPPLERPAQAALTTGMTAQVHGIISQAMRDLSLAAKPFWAGRKVLTSGWIIAGNEERPSAEDLLAEPGADLALAAIPDLSEGWRKAGPRDPTASGVFAAVDRRIESLATRAKKLGMETIVVSASPMVQAQAFLPASGFLKPGWKATVDQQICHIFCPQEDVREAARRAKSLDRSVKVLSSRAEKAIYHIDHPRAGSVVLIAAPAKVFTEGPDPGRGAQGHLPLSPDDYGVLVSSAPLPAVRGRPFLRTTEVAGILADLAGR